MKCVKCNMENPSDSGFCQYCGEKIVVSDDRRYSQLNTVIISILIFALLIACIYLYDKYSKAKEQNDFFDKSAGIVIDNKTKYYHTYNCQIFQDSDKGIWIYNVEWANKRAISRARNVISFMNIRQSANIGVSNFCLNIKCV